MTYNVFGGTLNLAQSINMSVDCRVTTSEYWVTSVTRIRRMKCCCWSTTFHMHSFRIMFSNVYLHGHGPSVRRSVLSVQTFRRLISSFSLSSGGVPLINKGVNRITCWSQGVASLPHKCQPPLPSTRQHLSYGDCLEVKREYYQNCSVLGCVTHCSQSAAHSYEQFLQVQQIGFVTLGPLRRA